jgi:hypothetical protein
MSNDIENPDLHGYLKTSFYYKNPQTIGALEEKPVGEMMPGTIRQWDGTLASKSDDHHSYANFIFGYRAFYDGNRDEHLPWTPKSCQDSICTLYDGSDRVRGGETAFGYNANGNFADGLLELSNIGSAVGGSIASALAGEWSKALSSAYSAYRGIDAVASSWGRTKTGLKTADICITYPNQIYNHVRIEYGVANKEDRLWEPTVFPNVRSPRGLPGARVVSWTHDEGNGDDGGRSHVVIDLELDKLREAVTPTGALVGDPFYSTYSFVFMSAEHGSQRLNLGAITILNIRIAKQSQPNPLVKSRLLMSETDDLTAIAYDKSFSDQIYLSPDSATDVSPIPFPDEDVDLEIQFGKVYCRQGREIRKIYLQTDFLSGRPYEPLRQPAEPIVALTINGSQFGGWTMAAQTIPNWASFTDSSISGLPLVYTAESGGGFALTIDSADLVRYLTHSGPNLLTIRTGYEDRGRQFAVPVNKQSWKVERTWNLRITERTPLIHAQLLPALDLSGQWTSSVGFQYELITAAGGDGRQFRWQRSDGELGVIEVNGNLLSAEWGHTGGKANGQITRRGVANAPIELSWDNGLTFTKAS